MTGEELKQVLSVMQSLWPQAEVIEKWGPGMAVMCGDLSMVDTMVAIRDLAVPRFGPAPQWPPAPGAVAKEVRNRADREYVSRMLEADYQLPPGTPGELNP